uniref:Phospholipid-transporting ATPase n=1 Tax=Cacopsylla melanoneura TaxID=428564 RepID=A0A8D9F8N4_9HEMI
MKKTPSSVESSKNNPENFRKIRANNRTLNSQFNYANNYIKTSKYSFLTFLPLNLLEQFQRLANFYFLCLMLLQMISVISSLTPVTTIIPLVGVLSLTAIKDAYDDIQRHISDNQVNERSSKVFRDGALVREKWSAVCVGDIIQMESNQFVAADVLLLSTSEPNGLAFIETSELDGETNLKCRQCIPETAQLGHDVGNFDGDIICETPNNLLNKFDGVLYWKNSQYVLDNDKIVLRGCVLRNTAFVSEWCYGVVIFTGRDTKLMQNSGKTKFKRTSIDRLLNLLIIRIVLFLLTLCLFCSVACFLWEVRIGVYFQIYLPWESIIPSDDKYTGCGVIAFLIFFSYVIVMNTLVPISLYVSVEVIRFAQSLLINSDPAMYCPRKQMFAQARTTTLNEELGQIEYIFSDKTGTLTQNIMTFNKCSISGTVYGDLVNEETGTVKQNLDISLPSDFSWNKYMEKDFAWFDKSLLTKIRSPDTPPKEQAIIYTYFRTLALCHTVMAETRTTDDRLVYQAQSPDEAALVSAARNFGFVFKERSPNSITIEVQGKQEVHQLLCILDFNNVRKRMSVVLKFNNKIQLYCKGADSVIYQRLRADQERLKEKTLRDLNNFASDGLRTLVLAVRDVNEGFYNRWKMRHGQISMENVTSDIKEEKLSALFDEIESELTLVGVTAIEDKLQDDVPKTIANLLLAGIKMWVLTGDKQETAINIGYSCELLNDDMELLLVEGATSGEVHAELTKLRDKIRASQLAGQEMLEHKTSQDRTKPGATQNGTRKNGGGAKLKAASVDVYDERDLSIVTFNEDTTVINEHNVNHVGNGTTAAPEQPVYALVIQGHSLMHALSAQQERLFVEVSTQCRSCICCRVTPLQKAMVVQLIQNYKKARTLAIGDGANDVSMIKTAHVGIGISGLEGNQAMLASDYSIAQFRFLERLLLVHGRWSYIRICKFLRYFFYKNFTFTLCHFWYAMFCGFSVQTILYISVFNLFYTSLPILTIAVFDQDVSDTNSLRYPKLYEPGMHNRLFNEREFVFCSLHGFYTSAVMFAVVYGTFIYGVDDSGRTISDYAFVVTVLAFILVSIVSVQILFDTQYWTYINTLALLISLASYFGFTYVFSLLLKDTYYVFLKRAMTQPCFWLCVLVIIVLDIIPVISRRFYLLIVSPNLSDRIRMRQRILKANSAVESESDASGHGSYSNKKPRRSIRSGYAFAHQEGKYSLV